MTWDAWGRLGTAWDDLVRPGTTEIWIQNLDFDANHMPEAFDCRNGRDSTRPSILDGSGLKVHSSGPKKGCSGPDQQQLLKKGFFKGTFEYMHEYMYVHLIHALHIYIYIYIYMYN